MRLTTMFFLVFHTLCTVGAATSAFAQRANEPKTPDNVGTEAAQREYMHRRTTRIPGLDVRAAQVMQDAAPKLERDRALKTAVTEMEKLRIETRDHIHSLAATSGDLTKEQGVETDRIVRRYEAAVIKAEQHLRTH